MVNKKNWFGLLVMVLVLGMMIIGCDFPDEERIIGLWENYPMTNLSFKSDNTVAIWVTGWGTENYSYELYDKTLELTNKDGIKYTGNFKFDSEYKGSGQGSIYRLILSNFNAGGHLYFINRTYTKK